MITRHPARYAACRHCQAWVEARAASCPICGIEGPADARRTQLAAWAREQKLAAVILAVVGAGAALALKWHAVAFVVSAGIGWLGGGQLDLRWLAGRIDRRRERSVLAIRDQLLERVAELQQDSQRIANLRVRLQRELPREQSAAAIDALDAAADAGQRQQQRLQIELWRVALAQWQNQLQPALAIWRRASEAQAAEEVARVDRARAELKKVHDGWLQTPLGQSDAGRAVLQQAAKLDVACESLKRALLVRQAVALAGKAPGVAAAFDRETAAGDVQDHLDVLAERQELGDFLSQTGDARHEAQRLRAESAAVSEIERMLAPARAD